LHKNVRENWDNKCLGNLHAYVLKSANVNAFWQVFFCTTRLLGVGTSGVHVQDFGFFNPDSGCFEQPDWIWFLCLLTKR